MENSFTHKEKLGICSLLIRVIDDDNIQKDEVNKLLFDFQQKLQLSQSYIQ